MCKGPRHLPVGIWGLWLATGAFGCRNDVGIWTSTGIFHRPRGGEVVRTCPALVLNPPLWSTGCAPFLQANMPLNPLPWPEPQERPIQAGDELYLLIDWGSGPRDPGTAWRRFEVPIGEFWLDVKLAAEERRLKERMVSGIILDDQGAPFRQAPYGGAGQDCSFEAPNLFELEGLLNEDPDPFSLLTEIPALRLAAGAEVPLVVRRVALHPGRMVEIAAPAGGCPEAQEDTGESGPDPADP